MAIVTLPIRRLRRTPFVTDEKQWLFHQGLRLDMETGVGLLSGQGSDPQVMLRWSDDGGHTWSKEHWVGAGAIGQYKRRAKWNRLGRSRQRIYEIVLCEPVKAVLIGAELDIAKGAH